MATPSVHGSIHRRSSDECPDRTEGNRSPPILSPRDLISALPDAVIPHIFSFLPFRDVVKTSVLSKRWRSTWTKTTRLEFHGVRPLAHNACLLDFPSLVDSVLSQCTSPTVKKFHIADFEYDDADRPQLDHWLHFATLRHVEDLRLLITEWRPRYKLPPFLYCSSRLVRLEVSKCWFSLDVTIRWPCLKVLSIEDSALSEDVLEGIFRGSPVLESVELRRCSGLKNIRIDSTSVKDLVLIGGSSIVEKIWAPYLLSLCVSGTWSRLPAMFKLDDISSLVEAKLIFSIQMVASREKRMCYDLLKGLLEGLCGVPSITIGGWCLPILSLFEMEGVPCPLSKCQNLTLHAPVNQWDLPGMAYMLRSSQFLERLVIHLTILPTSKYRLSKKMTERFNYDEEEFLRSRKGSFQCLAKHLNRVEIIGFKTKRFGSKYLLAMIKFLLGDTLALEKMIIKADLRTHGPKRLQADVLWKLLGVSQNVLSCRRASKNAEVNFTYSFK